MKRATWIGLGAASLLAAGVSMVMIPTNSLTESYKMREAWAAPRVNVTSRARQVGGQEVGEVLVDNRVIFRIRTGAGGYTAPQRAEVVADRLADMVNKGHLSADDVRPDFLHGEQVLTANGELLITADADHARINGTSPAQLAAMWGHNLSRALSGGAVASRPDDGLPGPGYGGASVEDVGPTLRSKIVPILSAGNGIRLGAAQVTGPERDVDDVKAVAEVEAQWKRSARARLYIPISDLNVTHGIHRVPRVGLSAIADVRLKF